MRKMKTKYTITAIACVAIGIGVIALLIANAPPKDEELIKNFEQHRDSYDKLRALIEGDSRISRLAGWGYHLEDSPVVSAPTDGGIPVEKYNEYIELLKKAEAEAIDRTRGEFPEVCIYVWSAGWAGNTKHAAICWLPNAVTNREDNVKAPSATLSEEAGTGRFALKRIERNWYLRKD
jgi:hypothetical protein